MKQESIGGRAFRVIFSLLFMAIGVWIISMAVNGETPAQPLHKPGDQIIMGVFGAMFCAISVLGIVYVLVSGCSKGPTIVASLATVICALFGLCFLSVAILQPGEIISTSSVNGIEMSRSKGGWSGAVVFSIVGILPLVFSRQIYRGYKKTLEKDN